MEIITNTNKMKKTDFILKIADTSDDICTMDISAWKGKYQVDKHICEKFPSLEKLDLADLMEGQLEYCGDMTKQQMANELIKLGFKVQVI